MDSCLLIWEPNGQVMVERGLTNMVKGRRMAKVMHSFIGMHEDLFFG